MYVLIVVDFFMWMNMNLNMYKNDIVHFVVFLIKKYHKKIYLIYEIKLLLIILFKINNRIVKF
jgi:hypothetical protein